MSGWQDPLAYPGTNNAVLVNKFGERDFDKLRRLEYAATYRRVQELEQKPIKGDFDLKHLQAVHRYVFQDVYAWAGELRGVEMSKGGNLFAPVRNLESYGAKIFGQLAQERHLAGLDKGRFVDRLAYHYGEINGLHPFREGNGRATQVFLQQLARAADYEIDYTRVDKTRWNVAARESFDGRLGPMRDVFTDIVSPTRAIAFDRMKPSAALNAYPDLANAIDVLQHAANYAETKFKRMDDKKRFYDQTRQRISKALHEGRDIAPHRGQEPEPDRSRGRSR